MKNFKKIIMLFIIMILTLSIFTACKENNIAKKLPYAEGTFIQSWMLNDYSEEDYEREFQTMVDMKIKYLVFMNAAELDANGNYAEVTYPSVSVSRQSENFNTVVLSKVLANCEQYGIKCFIGMINDSQWWDNFDLTNESHKQIFINTCNEMGEVASEIYNLYAALYPNAFYGFYFPTELFNYASFKNASSRALYAANAAEGFNNILAVINSLDSSKPLLFSPFVNPLVFLSNAVDNGLFYLDLINAVNFRSFDIFCPQDSIGARSIDVEDIYPWYQGYKYAVENANKDITFGINCECFATRTADPDYLYPVDIKTFTAQMNAASEYTDIIYTFAFPHYYNSDITLDGFYESYLNYLTNGIIENISPSVVEVSGMLSLNTIDLTWTAGSDDYDIAGYNIKCYSENSELSDTVIIRAGVFEKETIEYTYTMRYSEGYYYIVEAMDCSGNISQSIFYPE